MDLTPREDGLLDGYLAPFLALAGHRRTARLLAETVRGIVGSESLVGAASRAFPLGWPPLGRVSGGSGGCCRGR